MLQIIQLNIISYTAKIYFGTSNATEKINKELKDFHLNEEESDILQEENCHRLFIGYKTSDNIFTLDEKDILIHESLYCKPTHTIALTSLEDWREISEKYPEKFEQIIFYHAGTSLQSFIENETDLTIFIILFETIESSKFILNNLIFKTNKQIK